MRYILQHPLNVVERPSAFIDEKAALRSLPQCPPVAAISTLSPREVLSATYTPPPKTD